MARSSTRSCLPRGQTGIQNFARTTKAGVSAATAATTKAEEKASGRNEKVHLPVPVTPSKKRKLDDSNLSSETTEEKEEAASEQTPSKTLKLGELTVSTPSKKTRPRRRDNHHQSNQPATPDRPPCFDDFLRLHLSFLKALNLHFAHNGAPTPADLQEFLVSIERLWRKRKVSVKDLQRLVWVWHQDATASKSTGRLSFRISNFGLGKVCLECIRSGDTRQFVDENGMQGRFERILESFYVNAFLARSTANVDSDYDNNNFIGTLGLAPIHKSLAPFVPFRKGQQRLQDLKNGVIKVKTEAFGAQMQDGSSTLNTLDATTDRRKNLLDRIKTKELHQTTLPPPPSKEMLLRRAAAERVEDVVRVLASLRPADDSVGSNLRGTGPIQRKPYRVDTIVQHVQDSLPSPVSRHEIETCLDILAQTNVAGHWISIVTVKDIRSVVLKTCNDVSTKDIGERVRRLKIGYVDC